MERSLLLFENSVKSKYSYVSYRNKLNMFKKFVGANSYDEITRMEDLQVKLEDWIMSIKSRVHPNSVGVRAMICVMIRLVEKSGIRCNEEKNVKSY